MGGFISFIISFLLKRQNNNKRRRFLLLSCISGICYIICSIFQGLTLLILNGIICKESRLEGNTCSLGIAGISSIMCSLLWFTLAFIIFWFYCDNNTLTLTNNMHHDDDEESDNH